MADPSAPARVIGRQKRKHDLQLAVAGIIYLTLTLWTVRAVIPDPMANVPIPKDFIGRPAMRVVQSDYRMVVGVIATHADKLLGSPGDLTTQGQCYPLWRPYTLGEHMFGTALLAALPLRLLGDPILAFNVAFAATLWIAAMAMFVLTRHFTGDVVAALIAGALFAFHPARVTRVIHPYAFANQWTPLALLFAHRLFAHAPSGRSGIRDARAEALPAPMEEGHPALRGWLDALALALVLCLQLLESFYQVIALALLGGIYGIFLLVRYRDRLLGVLPRLAIVALICVGFAALIFGPYLHTRSAWGVLEGRQSLYLTLRDWAPGAGAWIGWTTAVLAAIGIADRLRGPRREAGDDPRIALLLGGLLVAWGTIVAMKVPLLGRVWSPVLLAAEWVPGLASVRVLRAIWLGAHLVACFLAAYGALALLELCGERTRAAVAVTAALCLAVLLESFQPQVARASFQRGTGLAALPLAIPPIQKAVYGKVPEGAVLDLPLRYDLRGKLNDMSSYVLASGYHRRAVAACYNSFRTDLQAEIAALAARLPDPAATDALYALGFRTIAVHPDLLTPPEIQHLLPLISDATRAPVIASTRRLWLYELHGPAEVVASFAPLASSADTSAGGTAAGASTAPQALGTAPQAKGAAPQAKIDLTFRNSTAQFYRHPDPIEPTPLVVTWIDDAGREVAESRITALLPLALAPGEQAKRTIEVPVTVPAGSYTVIVKLAAADQPVLARQAVRVGAS